ncbi:Pentatricopeptide repeat [Parasponia andersonii]|uniref:Pentatricopeptide repeat n=1 Tax=Parasponia andersonii TaxID=3476 RepID=A0A2P5CSB4_PARAD|nr:Pentatricopeptide repeat [Parasponia andersonii]
MVAAMELFQDILEEKEHPCNEVTYGTMINGKLYADKRIRPSVDCFNPIIHSLYRDGRMDEALNLLQDIMKLGVVPSVLTYTSLVHGLCKYGRWEEAKRFLIDMLRNGISPDVQTYNVLIDSLCKEDRIEEAISLFIFYRVLFLAGKSIKCSIHELITVFLLLAHIKSN